MLTSVIILASLVLSLTGCAYVEEESDYLIPAFDFVEKVETNQPEEAWKLLSKEAQAKVSVSQLITPDRDLMPVVEAFNRAILTPTPDKQLNLVVQNLGGQRGTIQISLIEQDGKVKIANIGIVVSEQELNISGRKN